MPECLACQKYPGANCSYDLCLLRSLPSVEGVECGVGWVELVLDQPELSRPQSARVRLSAPSPYPLWASIGWGEQKRGLIPNLSRETRVWSHTPIISGLRLHLLQGYIAGRLKSAVTDELAVRMQPEPSRPVCLPSGLQSWSNDAE